MRAASEASVRRGWALQGGQGHDAGTPGMCRVCVLVYWPGDLFLCSHTSPLQAWPEWDDLSTVAALPVGGPALSATGRRSSRASLPMARLATSDSLAENGRRWSLHLSVTGAGAPATPSASAPASDVAVAGGTAQTSTGPAGGAWGKAADQAGAARGLLDRGHGVAEAAGAWETPSSHRLPAPRPSTSGCEGTRGAAGGGRKSLATAGMSEGMAAGTPPTRVHVGQGFVVSQDALEKLEVRQLLCLGLARQMRRREQTEA